ncbi:hypothetical protein ACFC1B_06900 [Streptomyces xiamenensis]|uniref:helix-turn-helix domain-containing protein n=1 Tax=Streptomyces xiamenensis TaxID=408015 RepID=UPI0035DECAFC
MTSRDAADHGMSMRTMLVSWRGRVDINTLEGIESAPQYLLRTGRLTQALMAHLMGVDVRHYRRIEYGEPGVGIRYIEECARILDLNHAEASALYISAGHPPPPEPEPERREIPEHLLTLMHRTGHAAYWSDTAYYVLTCNSRAGWHWPWLQRPGANMMLELLSPDSEGRAHCGEWEQRWAPPLVAQLRHVALQMPHHTRLQDIVRQVRQWPEVRRIWDEDERAELRRHAYGTIRPGWSRWLGRDVDIAIEALVPPSRPDLRLIACPLIGEDEDDPPLPCGPPPPFSTASARGGGVRLR